ncbi:MAG: hypothetical protein LBJ83_00190 [Oscillospiraceae bacterium]|jgi:hypothetical protein|nr:hypothetical protein [Oscillospiraceae bacterium]
MKFKSSMVKLRKLNRNIMNIQIFKQAKRKICALLLSLFCFVSIFSNITLAEKRVTSYDPWSDYRNGTNRWFLEQGNVPWCAVTCSKIVLWDILRKRIADGNQDVVALRAFFELPGVLPSLGTPINRPAGAAAGAGQAVGPDIWNYDEKFMENVFLHRSAMVTLEEYYKASDAVQTELLEKIHDFLSDQSTHFSTSCPVLLAAAGAAPAEQPEDGGDDVEEAGGRTDANPPAGLGGDRPPDGQLAPPGVPVDLAEGLAIPAPPPGTAAIGTPPLCTCCLGPALLRDVLGNVSPIRQLFLFNCLIGAADNAKLTNTWGALSPMCQRMFVGENGDAVNVVMRTIGGISTVSTSVDPANKAAVKDAFEAIYNEVFNNRRMVVASFKNPAGPVAHACVVYGAEDISAGPFSIKFLYGYNPWGNDFKINLAIPGSKCNIGSGHSWDFYQYTTFDSY